MYVYNGLVIFISSLNESYMIRDTSLFIRKVISLNKRYTYESTLAFLFISITPDEIFYRRSITFRLTPFYPKKHSDITRNRISFSFCPSVCN